MNSIYNKDFRQKLINDPKAVLMESNVELSKDVEIVVKKASKDIMYFVMPSESTTLNFDTLQDIDAAGCAGSASTIGSVGTASTTSTATTSVGSLGSVSSVGSLASAGSK